MAKTKTCGRQERHDDLLELCIGRAVVEVDGTTVDLKPFWQRKRLRKALAGIINEDNPDLVRVGGLMKEDKKDLIEDLPNIVPDAFAIVPDIGFVFCLEVGHLFHQSGTGIARMGLYSDLFWVMDAVGWQVEIIHCPFETEKMYCAGLNEIAIKGDCK